MPLQFRLAAHGSLLCVLGLFAGIAGCQRESPATSQSPVSTQDNGRVAVQFQFSDTRQVTRLVEDVPAGSTVLSVMQKIEDPTIEISGSGAMALITKIGDAENGGETGWTYSINGEWAERGIGDTTVSGGDEIQWRYGTWEDLQASSDDD